MFRSISGSVILGYIIIAVVVGALAAALLLVANGAGQSAVSAQAFVNLQQGVSVHAGFRRAHAKGFCIAGDFVSSGELASLTKARLFTAGVTPFTGRISVAGNNPTAPDLAAPVRSLALSIGEGRQRWHTAMNTPPVMPVRTAEAFYQQLQVLAPDPKTGQRDAQKIAAFFAAHPETATFRQWQAGYQPSSSFATERYHSINAFYLVNQQGEQQAVRWAAVPVAEPLNVAVLGEELAADVLQQEFTRLVAQQPVRFNLSFTLAQPQDDAADPTVLWPAERQQLIAGQLVIREVHTTDNSSCDAINFDPLILPLGMLASADPILRARSAAYAESYRRRAREQLLNTTVGARP